MDKNVAVLWDIENVAPLSGQSNILVDGLLSYSETIGNKSYMIAVGDWINCPKTLPEILSEKGFELIYIPEMMKKESVQRIVMFLFFLGDIMYFKWKWIGYK
ncbi:hypothetical protein [Marispirochaeta sp.]|uniref:hypothetical protein n=1 Tax=Marispirochaeta sp. TaxID=2038653 RepID=UPI0029C615FC|nr:hypothetical protein [Marispirochaeta sp.]